MKQVFVSEMANFSTNFYLSVWLRHTVHTTGAVKKTQKYKIFNYGEDTLMFSVLLAFNKREQPNRWTWISWRKPLHNFWR